MGLFSKRDTLWDHRRAGNLRTRLATAFQGKRSPCIRLAVTYAQVRRRFDCPQRCSTHLTCAFGAPEAIRTPAPASGELLKGNFRGNS